MLTLPSDFWARVEALLGEPSDRLPDLVKAGILDKATAFRHGDLRGCDLRGDDLAKFDFTGADFARARVAGTSFNDAILTGADLSSAIGVEQAVLDFAIYDETTRWRKHPWADAAGRDVFGPWASFTVTGKEGTPVTQRLRWCPAGSFRMGSPKKEEGRFASEDQSGPITFPQGFWMFETPCTQALWMAVMDGNNPSHFQGADRPVEQVSHRDVLRFIQRLNRMKRGLGMTLPSEAQWEYACRAGTDDATYAGPALIKGKDNAGILNEIAWWGGNSGSETHAVGQKQPNSWGLHDMLGNVWEWCADAWHENHDGVAFDGGPRDGGSAAWRVFRGGSWIDDARDVRAAGRRWGEPGDRLDDLGFRCARGLSVSTARSERRDAGPGKRRERSDQVAGARTTRRAGGAS